MHIFIARDRTSWPWRGIVPTMSLSPAPPEFKLTSKSILPLYNNNTMANIPELGQLMSSPALPQHDQMSQFEELMFREFPDHADHAATPQQPALTGAFEKQQKYSKELSKNLTSRVMSTFYPISKNVDQADMTSLHYLIQTAIADSKGYTVLSEDEVLAVRRDLDRAREKTKEAVMRIEREKKMEEAAGSLAKYHLGEGSPKKALQAKTKRLSIQALTELQTSRSRLSQLQQELDSSQGMVHRLELQLREHMIAVLGLTHVGSRTDVSRHYLEAVEGKVIEDGKEGAPTTPVLVSKGVSIEQSASNGHVKRAASIKEEEEDQVGSLSRGMSVRTLNRGMSMKSNLSRGMSIKSNLMSETMEDEKLESLILTVSSVIPMQESPGPLPSTRKKLDHLEEVTRILVRQFVTIDTTRQEQETELQELHHAINRTVAELDPTKIVPTGNHAEVLVKSATSYKIKMNRDNENLLQMISMLELMQSSNGELDNVAEAGRMKQLKKLQESYGANRAALEQLELENVDLQNSLKDINFASNAERERLRGEQERSQEQMQEWIERCDATREELESVLKSLEDLTRQSVEYESERTKMETTIRNLQGQLLKASNESVDKRMSMVTVKSPLIGQEENLKGELVSNVSLPSSTASTPKVAETPMSVVILQHEFRKILQDVNRKHSNALLEEQREMKKMQSLLRSYKGLSSVNDLRAQERPGSTSSGLVKGLAV